jgi:hypothetical protein
MAQDLKSFITEEVSEILLSAGYVRGGRTFRFTDDGVNYAIVEFDQQQTKAPVVWFEVGLGVVIPNSRPHIPREFDLPVLNPGMERANFQARVEPSGATTWARLSGFHDTSGWGVDLSIPYEPFAIELRNKLRDAALPLLHRLLTERAGTPEDVSDPITVLVSQPPFSAFKDDPDMIARLNASVEWKLDIDLENYFEKE